MSLTQSTTITRASREWLMRPDDERYLSLDDLYAATFTRAHQSRVRTLVNQSLVARGSEDARGTLHLEHEELGFLAPTHWSLGQLATISRTPAKWTGYLEGALRAGLRRPRAEPGPQAPGRQG